MFKEELIKKIGRDDVFNELDNNICGELYAELLPQLHSFLHGLTILIDVGDI